jgi:hypothetical protein
MRVSLAFTLLSSACLSGTTEPVPLPPGGLHVLFVGNSLTYTNDLPATLAAIGTLGGDTIRVASAAGADLALIDHLNGASDALAQLRLGGWQFVVLQQGPTPAGLCRDSLVLWSRMFGPRIHAAGARAAVLMSWPGATHQNLFDEVRVSLEAASIATDSLFLPAGEAWRAAWRADPTLALYGPDGFHPSEIGTFLTALEIYERLTGHDARSLPARAVVGSRALALPETTIRLLQRAAHDANSSFPSTAAPTAEELARPSVFVPSGSGC